MKRNTYYTLLLLISIITTQAIADSVACTMEARMCPDGKTFVGRTGPTCEFTPCPGETTGSSTMITPPVPISPKSMCPNITPTLRIGQKNTQVKILQDYIFPYYGLSTRSTGYFGSVTRTYIIRFQKERGIVADGVVGPITQEIVKNICEGREIPTVPSYPKTPSASCKIWFDGCNTCSRTTPGGPMMCTMMACIQGNEKAAECRVSF